jgi:predicted ATP-binding protein involved in virulence
MFAEGTKLKHIKSPTFVNEMVDAFNITVIHTGHGPKVMVTAGRDSIDVQNETFITKDNGMATVVKEDDSVLVRYTVANLTIPLESARSLAKALHESIALYDEQIAAISAPQAG